MYILNYYALVADAYISPCTGSPFALDKVLLVRFPNICLSIVRVNIGNLI